MDEIDLSKESIYILEYEWKEYYEKTRHMNYFTDEFKSIVKYYNAICDELNRRGYFDE